MNLDNLLKKKEFPRSARYDADFQLSNQMGPNSIWLLEELCEKLRLTPGMKVLDLGCGKGMTSIFLAKEFGVQVWAVDLWINPDHNWQRVVNAGVGHLVYPLKAEAHALPFAKGFFDAVISIDAYQFFGTDILYLDYLACLVKPDGQFGMVMPGWTQPLPNPVPLHLSEPQSNGKAFWEPGCSCFQTADFWRNLWSYCPLVTGITASIQPDGWRHWRDFESAIEKSGNSIFPSCAEALDKDGGRYLGFVRMTAQRNDVKGFNAYDPNIGELMGISQ